MIYCKNMSMKKIVLQEVLKNSIFLNKSLDSLLS